MNAPLTYEADRLDHIAFPLGGLGAGSLCLTGTGGFDHVALRHQPAMHHAPLLFAAVGFPGRPELARVLEGPVPWHRIYGRPGTGLGLPNTSFGLPRFASARFAARFPFAEIELQDEGLPVAVQLTGWSPFVPGHADASSLPFAALEYTLRNTTAAPVETVFSFHSGAFLRTPDSPAAVAAAPQGFSIQNPGSTAAPHDEACFTVECDAEHACADLGWFRGGWFDVLSMVWCDVRMGALPARPAHPDGDPSPGASLHVPLTLAAGEVRSIRLRLSWFVPTSRVRRGDAEQAPAPALGDHAACHRPWYASRFADAAEATAWWRTHYDDLRERSDRFSTCLHDTTLPAEVMDAVTANLCILKSPTVLRQHDGRFWAWEGCDDKVGSCYGTCTHVWNYAQAMAHLFPALERGLRETEHHEALAEDGHQEFRTPIPIRRARHAMHAAADGQLGGIIKAYRDWRISGDLDWIRVLWRHLCRSLDYAIRHWDPDREGWLVEPQHNTYDVEFWGPNGMLTSVYAAALQATVRIGTALGEDVTAYADLAARAVDRLENDLFNGTWFVQRVRWQGLRAGDPAALWSLGGKYSPEAVELLRTHGPKYQYGEGVLADGIIGAWFAAVAGLDGVFTPAKVAAHLRAVFTHNFRRDLSTHSNPQRPGYALRDEPGLLLCTWPHGGEPALPFVYSNEVWTGIEYQVASHLILTGQVDAGLTLVRAVRTRYDGRHRNPFDEYECGHWYARALSSYALLQALSGARYDAVDRVLHFAPRLSGDFRSFLAWDGGYGTVGVREGAPFVEIVSGELPYRSINYTPFHPSTP